MQYRDVMTSITLFTFGTYDWLVLHSSYKRYSYKNFYESIETQNR